MKAGLPVVSMDTKKKELLGNFYRDGKIDTQETIETNDHDFGSAGAGVVIPHSLYDVGKNKGFIHLNTSHDTSELACDSLAAWWDQQGRADYPQAQKLLVLCDGGGSNSATCICSRKTSRSWPAGWASRSAWPTTRLTARSTIRLSIACSAFDPGLPRSDLPHPGDRSILHGQGRNDHRNEGQGEHPRQGVRHRPQVRRGSKKAMKIVFDSFLPKWNYTAVPEPV